MTKNLTKHFIRLPRLSLAADSLPELRLNHAERGFYVAPPVIVLHESLLIVLVEVKHLPPHVAAPAVLVRRVTPEVYVRHPAFNQNEFQILFCGISLVSYHTLKREAFGGRLYERPKLRAVSPVPVGDFNRRHDVGFHPAQDV